MTQRARGHQRNLVLNLGDFLPGSLTKLVCGPENHKGPSNSENPRYGKYKGKNFVRSRTKERKQGQEYSRQYKAHRQIIQKRRIQLYAFISRLFPSSISLDLAIFIDDAVESIAVFKH